MKIEIMFNDLKENKQKELLSFLGIETPEECNYDTIPLFILSDIQAINSQNKFDRVVVSLLIGK